MGVAIGLRSAVGEGCPGAAVGVSSGGGASVAPGAAVGEGCPGAAVGVSAGVGASGADVAVGSVVGVGTTGGLSTNSGGGPDMKSRATFNMSSASGLSPACEPI